MPKRLSQFEAVALVTIERGEANRVMPITERDIDKLIRRGLVEQNGNRLRLTPEGTDALRRWIG